MHHMIQSSALQFLSASFNSLRISSSLSHIEYVRVGSVSGMEAVGLDGVSTIEGCNRNGGNMQEGLGLRSRNSCFPCAYKHLIAYGQIPRCVKFSHNRVLYRGSFDIKKIWMFLRLSMKALSSSMDAPSIWLTELLNASRSAMNLPI